MKYCDKCHKEYEDNSKFCPECGELLQEMNSFKEDVMICPVCQRKYPEDACFCEHCGRKLIEITNNQPELIDTKNSEMPDVINNIDLKEDISPNEVQYDDIKTKISIASFVVSLVSILTQMIPFLGIIVSTIALVLGIVSFKETKYRFLDITGIVISGVSLIIGFIFTIIALV